MSSVARRLSGAESFAKHLVLGRFWMFLMDVMAFPWLSWLFFFLFLFSCFPQLFHEDTFVASQIQSKLSKAEAHSKKDPF